MEGLYVHVPFCVRKCSYCDFYSVPLGDVGQAERLDFAPAANSSSRLSRLREAYVNAVIKEAEHHRGRRFQTLYLGGGTPSLLGQRLLEQLVGGLKRVFDLSGVVEATMEVNPDSATRELLQSAREAGINRLSVGIQSLSDAELQSVGRVHRARQACNAIEMALQAGFRSVSADLIIGLPGQTWGSLHDSIERTVSLGVHHLSLYCLSLEEGTPLHAHPPSDLPSEDTQAELFSQARQHLLGEGFAHYEISNFARRGHECLHNLNYWRGGQYLGLGPAAASHLDGKRFRNRPDVEAYLADPSGQTEYVETLRDEEKAGEEAMLRLRLLEEGLDLRSLIARFGVTAVSHLSERLEAMARRGELVRKDFLYSLPPSRILTSNPIFAEVLSPQAGGSR